MQHQDEYYWAALVATKPGSRVRQADIEHAAHVVRRRCHAALCRRRDTVRQSTEVAQHLHTHPMPFDDAALLRIARFTFA